MFADPRHDELVDLAFAICDGVASDDNVERLENLLTADPVTRLLYLQCVELHLELNDRFGRSLGSDDFTTRYEELRRQFLAFNAESSLPTPFPPPPVVVPPPPAPSFFFPTMLLSLCVVGAAMLGIGIMIGLRDAPKEAPPMDWTPPAIAKVQPPPPPEAAVVGKIAGMFDCKWGDPSSAVRSTTVALGRKYVLTSGVLEICYDTGARVLLQGPVTYEVDSKNGGVLSAGKLTGQVTTKSARGLTIRTPAATVTDLGTEFGVDVQPGGATATHVFRGAVEVQTNPRAGSSMGETFRLTQNESLQVEKDHSTVRRGKADPVAFVLPQRFDNLLAQEARASRWSIYSRQLCDDPALVAYYTFEPKSGHPTVLPNVSSVGSELDGHISGAQWVAGRLPGKRALQFRGPNFNDRVTLPKPERFNFPGAFSIALWFKVDRFTSPWQTFIIKNGNEGWRLHRYDTSDVLDFATSDATRMFGHVNVADGHWHLAVVVVTPSDDGAIKTLYVDGRFDAKRKLTMAQASDEVVTLGGNDWVRDEQSSRNLEGAIDELAFFSRALSPKEITAMFKAGDPLGDVTAQKTDEN